MIDGHYGAGTSETHLPRRCGVTAATEPRVHTLLGQLRRGKKLGSGRHRMCICVGYVPQRPSIPSLEAAFESVGSSAEMVGYGNFGAHRCFVALFLVFLSRS